MCLRYHSFAVHILNDQSLWFIDLFFQKVKSKQQAAKSRKPEAGSRKPVAGSRHHKLFYPSKTSFFHIFDIPKKSIYELFTSVHLIADPASIELFFICSMDITHNWY